MMAVGRGEFYRTFLDELERKLVLTSPGRWRPSPDQSGEEPRGQAEPENRPVGGRGGQGRQWAASHRGAPSVHRYRQEIHLKDVLQIKCTTFQLHHLDRLPQEVLMKIFSFLDASSLFCISHVSLLFNRLANDNVLWRRIYMLKFGSWMWRLRAEPEPATRAEPLPGHWKKVFLRAVAGREADRWKRELRNIRPGTGLPHHTQHFLRDQKVSWELKLCDHRGHEVTLRQSRAHFLQASVLLHWTQSFTLHFHHITTIQLYGVRKETLPTSTGSSPSSSSSSSSPSSLSPGWRSLILELDPKRELWNVIGADRFVKLILLSQGVVIAIWRATNTVAFILISLHLHKLVEKSLLGSPACPYSEPCEPLNGPAHPHTFSLHLVLNNMAAEILSGHFRPVSCRRVCSDPSRLEIKVVDGSTLSQLRPLSGNIQLQWQSMELEGAVENCCVMTLTLLDGAQTPCWCASSPVCVRLAPEPQPPAAYAGDSFLLDHREASGSVRMRLVRPKEQKQFFLISLSLFVPVASVGAA